MRTANDPGMTSHTIPPRFGVEEFVVPSGERRRRHQRRESGKTREMFGEIRLDEIPSFRFGFFAVAGEIFQRDFNLDGSITYPLVSHQKPGIRGRLSRSASMSAGKGSRLPHPQTRKTTGGSCGSGRDRSTVMSPPHSGQVLIMLGNPSRC